MLSQLKSGAKVVGAKETARAVSGGRAQMVFVAADASPRVIEPLTLLCTQHGIAVHVIPTMVELGRACDIAVGSAVAALVCSK